MRQSPKPLLPPDALDGLVRSYVAVCVGDRALVAVAVTDYYHVAREVDNQRRSRFKFLEEEWTHSLAQARDDLAPAEAVLLANAAQGLVTESVRSRSLGRRRRPRRRSV